MKTADKALNILDYFSESSPEHGLSDLARLSGLDKATTHRMLQTLARHGFVEQHNVSRKYRLGAGLLRLAHIREATAPVTSVVQPILEILAADTGETAHASLIAGDQLATIGIVESAKSTRVNIEQGLKLPLHATASGIAFLAFSPDEFVDKALGRRLASFTDRTETDIAKIRDQIARARKTGIGMVDQGFELEVVGIAAPTFDLAGNAVGAVAVATPSSRMSDAVQRTISEAVLRAAIDTTRGLGAQPHPLLLERAGSFAT
ncbi:MAG: IclR family transcriptional regulator [Hyphomicrobiales bacterium]|nr:IclR family transcriptional regulator [Hyphomicrobiales bacterium]